jgi:RHS repeat-associated protein
VQQTPYTYDPRDLLATVTNAESATDPSPKLTRYTYTDRGQVLRQTKANGNTVEHTYWADALLHTQTERKSNGTLVASHELAYSANGHRTSDVARVQNADNSAAYLDTTTTYTYDPRDRIAQLTKTPAGGTAAVESYVHDANDNVISQTIKGTTTTFGYDRNRLQSATSGGSTAAYNYDPFGRLDTVTSGGQLVEDYSYDGFDRISEHRKLVNGSLNSTRYTYDPLDRTASRTEKVGTPAAKTTEFAYLGLTEQLLDERVAGQLSKTYTYTPGGARLSQTTHKTDGTRTDGFYGYNPHTDVETVTDTAGNTRSTYAYTAYGTDDTTGFTGIDKPDPAQPDKPADNVYRYTAKRWDPSSGGYDMGFRDYSPGLNRFLTRDTYNGALADLHLGTDPYTGNRYALAAGNPITGIELDGHLTGGACGPDGITCGMTDFDTSGSYTPGPATGEAVGGIASDGRPAQLGVSAGDAASIYGARDSELVSKMERMGGGPLASSINIYAGKGLDAAIADARNPDLAPWQRAFAAAAYNALHAGLESGALRNDCHGTGQICPTDPSTLTPSDALLTATSTDGSSSGFDTQVAAATGSVAASAAIFSATALARQLGHTGELAAGIEKNTERIRVNGRYRIPDGLDRDNKIISEVKNVSYQHYSRQLRDYASWARKNGYSFELYVRSDTRLSGPLRQAILSRAITLRYFR